MHKIILLLFIPLFFQTNHIIAQKKPKHRQNTYSIRIVNPYGTCGMKVTSNCYEVWKYIDDAGWQKKPMRKYPFRCGKPIYGPCRYDSYGNTLPRLVIGYTWWNGFADVNVYF